MGGIGSGRYGSRATVRSGLILDLTRLKQQKLLRPGCSDGTITWNHADTGEPYATIGFAANIGPQEGTFRLIYTSTVSGQKIQSDYLIDLVSTPMRFGGRRWYFLCPRLGIRCSRLHLPSGATTFASRRAYRLAYPSQRESPRDRAIRTAFRARDRLQAGGGIGDYVPKPKGMRWATYDRLMERVRETEEVVDGYTADLIFKLNKRVCRTP